MTSPIDLIHVDFIHNIVSFARPGLVPTTYRPTHASLKRLTTTLNDMSYWQFAIRPHFCGFNAHRRVTGVEL